MEKVSSNSGSNNGNLHIHRHARGFASEHSRVDSEMKGQSYDLICVVCIVCDSMTIRQSDSQMATFVSSSAARSPSERAARSTSSGTLKDPSVST